MGTAMGLPAYLRLIAERIEEAEANNLPAEALRLVEIMRDELSSIASKRRVALADVLKSTG